jgi:hypothetical protein
MAPTHIATLALLFMETSGQNNVPATTTASIQQISCPLCWDASIPSNRDKNITQILLENVSSRQILESLGLKKVNCFQVYSIVQFLPADSISSSDCNSLQTGIGGICGCTPQPLSCQFCPNEDIPFPDAPYCYSQYAFNFVHLMCQKAKWINTSECRHTTMFFITPHQFCLWMQ